MVKVQVMIIHLNISINKHSIIINLFRPDNIYGSGLQNNKLFVYYDYLVDVNIPETNLSFLVL